MSKFVRSSKYRNVVVSAAPREGSYHDLDVSSSKSDGNLIAASATGCIAFASGASSGVSASAYCALLRMRAAAEQ